MLEKSIFLFQKLRIIKKYYQINNDKKKYIFTININREFELKKIKIQ